MDDQAKRSRLQPVLHNNLLLSQPFFPDWSPDGSQLAYAGDGGQSVYTCTATGKRIRRLTSGTQPAWSPDGRYIAFARDDGLYVMQRNGRGARRVVRTPTSPKSNEHFVLSSPSWHPISR